MSGERAPALVVVCGLAREGRMAAGPDIAVVCGGASARGLTAQLERLGRVRAVISFGIAGALDPDLRVGDIVAATSIVTRARQSWPATLFADPDQSFAERGRRVHAGPFVGVDEPVLRPAAKADLRARTGAIAVDMESQHAAEFARHRNVPFGALRIVSDTADTALPAIAGRAMRPDGSIDVGGVLLGLLRDPGQIPALLRTGRDAGTAFRALGRVRGLLGPRFGLQL